MPAKGTAKPRSKAKANGSGRRGKARPVPAFDTEAFVTTVGAGRTISTYRPKSYIFRQGTKCEAVYYLQQGHIELSVVSKEGKERVVGLLGRAASSAKAARADSPSIWRRRAPRPKQSSSGSRRRP